MTRSTWIAVLWTILILVLCWMPRHSLPMDEGGPSLLNRLHFDKVVHLGIFAVFAFLWRRAFSRRAVVVIVVAGLFLAVITELGQATSIVGRDADVWDAVADAIGVVVGAAFAEFLANWLARRVQPGAVAPRI